MGLSHFYCNTWLQTLFVLGLCQCPSSGLLHFYSKRQRTSQPSHHVSMPFFGLTPFLPCSRLCCGTWGCTVSMPFFGLTPFLRNHSIYKVETTPVSMPFFGLTPFLRISNRSYAPSQHSVNALLRAYSISTKCCKCHRQWKYRVSMPFFGLTPFLLICLVLFSIAACMCQCPSSGLLHFYGQE